MAPTKRHVPPKRTVQLPAALRDELVSLGRIPALGKGKTGRKERRKAARTDGNAAKAAHFAQKKRKANEQEEVEEEAAAPVASTSRDGPSNPKRKKAAPAPVVEPTPPPKKMTTLERMVAKQQGTAAVNPARKKNKVESTEDQEIAWLEAKLGVRGGAPAEEKGKWKNEYTEDGLDDLFAGLDELEDAAFGSDNEKDYAELMAEMQDSEDDSEGEDDDDSEGDSEDEEMGEYGASDEELFNLADDDDHDQMGEIGSEDSGSEQMLDDGSEEESEEEEPVVKAKGAKQVTFESPAGPIATPAAAAPGRYVPPHLRQAAIEPVSKPSDKMDAPPDDPRLRRQILGLLNKLSSLNMPTIIASLEAFYLSHPRATVSTILTSLILEIISGRDNLGEAFIISYAALVAAMSKSVGIELPAGVISKCIVMFDDARAKTSIPLKEGEVEVGFEGRPGSKECENLVGFLAELYNFQVIACVLVYDLVKLFIDSGLGEVDVELLVKIVRRSGQQLRQDDPSSLKEIISLVKQKMQGVEPSTMNSRTRFMIDALTNLKNNKIKPDANGAVDNYSHLKKFISGLKKRSGSTPEALRLSLADIRSSSTKGKWWIVGAAWGGDPLVENAIQLPSNSQGAASDEVLMKLAKKQGMNTDVRKGIFVVLMSSEDYVDACERLLQLGLTDVQQREIARVLLQCSGNEKTYNPYYTLVAHQMGTKSHGFQITLQYCLWDFLRELGEKGVGGEEMIQKISEESGTAAKVSTRRIANLAKLYAWCVAKEVLTLAIFKPVPFGRPRPQTIIFLQQFFTSLIISSQSPSPALILTSTGTRRDKESLERIFVKAAPFDTLLKGMLYFFETTLEEGKEKGEKEAAMIKWGVKVAKETMGVGGGIIDVR